MDDVTDAHGGPFTRSDLDRVARAAVEAWRSGADRDWSAPAGTLSWSCTRTADHCVDAVLAVGLFLASGRQDSYPAWAGERLMGDDATPERLAEALGAVATVVSGVVAVADPDRRAVIWLRPVPGTGTPPDFAARAALELVLHAHDVASGLGVPFEPPADACARLRDHTRGWPHWWAPGWSPAPTTDDPWADLLAASGRHRHP
jgi:hypothetical protein